MRVAWMDNAVEWGGVQEHLVFLSRLACDGGIEGAILCDRSLASRFRLALANHPVRIVAIPCHDLLSPRSWIRTYRAIRDFRPDVLHAHLYWAARIAAPMARLAGVRRVVETVHLEEGWRTGWRKLLNGVDRWVGRLLVDHHIAVSRAVARSLAEVRGILPEKISTIHNSVSEARSAPDIFRHGGALAFLGRLEPQKGLDVLLRALPVLERKGVEFDLVIGGEGTQRSGLEKLARELGVEDRIRFVGKVADRAAFFHDRSILVLPSRYEGFPLVLLEAGAHDQCVVASAVSGIPELIEHERTGLLVPKEDPEALASALARAIAEGSLRKRLSVGLAERVATEFSPQSFLHRTLEVLS